MAKLSELKQKRAQLIAEARAFVEDVTESEARSLNAEEVQKYETLTAEIDSLGATIDITADADKRSKSLTSAAVDVETASGGEAGAEYRNAFEHYVRYGKDSLSNDQAQILRGYESRSDTIMVKGTGNVGGYTVPVSFYPQIVEKLEQNSPIYALANKIETSSGEDLQVPQVTAHASATWVAENGGAFDSVSDTFAQVTLKSYLVAELAKLSVQLLQDSAVDLESYLARNIGGSIGRAVGTALSTGASNSTTTPQGLLTSASVGKTTASPTAIVPDEIVSMPYTVTPPYRNTVGTCWIMNDATVGTIRALKDSSNRYLWNAGYGNIVDGQADTLVGYPIYSDPNVAVIGATNVVAAFGNVNLGYTIRQAGTFQLRRLDERYADLFLVGFLGYMRIDGKLVDTNAVTTLKMHA